MPHRMEKYVHIQTHAQGGHLIMLKVGGQQFRVGPRCDTQEEAEWFREMLCFALERIAKGADD